MRLALYQPDIPQNTGSIMRLCACLGVGLDIIEPCGFVLDDKKLKRAGMDYLGLVNKTRHSNFESFCEATRGLRKILLTTKSDVPYTAFDFAPTDILVAGSESAGAPDNVHAACDARVTIPMQTEARSLNVALAIAMVLGEARRQCF